MNHSTFEALRNNALVKGFSSAQLESFYNAGRSINVGPGEILVRQGQGNNNLYLLLSGELEVYHPDNPERFTLAMCNPGDYVGEYAFIDAKQASATVKATQASELFKIAHESVNLLFESETDIGRIVYRNLLTNLVARLRKMDKEFDHFILAF